jgi:hypothetical protein
VLRHQELEAVAPSNLDQTLDVRWPRRRRQVARPRWHRFSGLREEPNVNGPWSVDDQCSSKSLADVAEGMHLTAWDLDEFACCGNPLLGTNAKLKVPSRM